MSGAPGHPECPIHLQGSTKNVQYSDYPNRNPQWHGSREEIVNVSQTWLVFCALVHMLQTSGVDFQDFQGP